MITYRSPISTFKLTAFCLGLLISLFASNYCAYAAEADVAQTIRNNLEKRTPPLVVKSVRQSPIKGLYEVFASGNIFYVDANVDYVIVGGNLMEDATRKNLTEQSLTELTTIDFMSLPFKNAIEIKKGTGEYKFAVFSDPDCPFCRKLERGLENFGANNYTAYIFLMPLRDVHPEAAAKSESIWCNKDRADAWLQLMTKNIEPPQATCDNPIAENEKLAARLGIAATPTIYLESGVQTQAPSTLIKAIKKEQ